MTDNKSAVKHLVNIDGEGQKERRNTMDYRPINIKDHQDRDIIIKFRRDTHEVGLEMSINFDSSAYIHRMEERIRKFPEGQLIIEDSGKPIGQVGFDIQGYNGDEIGYVNIFYLIPEYRGKGIGKEIIQYIEDFFIKSNVSEYHLRVSSKNEKAINLYTKIGMFKINEEDGGLRMKKILSK